MELAFNELSQTPLLGDKFNANARMVHFSEAVAEARRKGLINIRSHYATSEIKLTSDYSFRDWMFDRDFPAVYRELFYDMFLQPFIKEDDIEIEEKYIEANYFFEDTENQILKQECLGLTSAYLSETLAISFQSSPAWLKNTLRIIIERDNDVSVDIVYHVYSKECFGQNSIAEFIQSISSLNLVETTILPENKNIHLAEHHGKQELSELCNRLKYNLFVVEMRSMEWCRGKCNDFIKKVYPNGVIEVVLYKTDRKYALRVQTTGTNLHETQAIADILTEKYS